MGFYGSILEQREEQLLIESFSKKDLQDPNLIKKELAKTKKRVTASQTIRVITSFIIFCVGLSYPPTCLITLLGSPFLLAVTIAYFPNLSKKEDNKVQKLQDALLKLREKQLKNIEKHPDNKQKYQDIINKIDYNLNVIKKRNEEIAQKKYMDQVASCSTIYKKFCEVIWGNLQLTKINADGIFIVAKDLGMDINKLSQYIVKTNYPESDKLYNYIYNIIEDNDFYDLVKKNIFKENDDKYNLEVIKKHLSESGLGDKYIVISLNVEELEIEGYYYGYIFLDFKSKKIYSFNPDHISTHIKDGIKDFTMKEAEKLEELYDDYCYPKEIYIEADKALGYYNLSPCPEGIDRLGGPVIKF